VIYILYNLRYCDIGKLSTQVTDAEFWC